MGRAASNLPMPKRVHHDLRSRYVISQTVLTPAYPPLPSVGRKTNKLLNWILPASVVWVFGEDGHQLLQRLD